MSSNLGLARNFTTGREKGRSAESSGLPFWTVFN